MRAVHSLHGGVDVSESGRRAISDGAGDPCICATSPSCDEAQNRSATLEASDGRGCATSFSLGRACRNAANIKVRQPLGTPVRKGLGAGSTRSPQLIRGRAERRKRAFCHRRARASPPIRSSRRCARWARSIGKSAGQDRRTPEGSRRQRVRRSAWSATERGQVRYWKASNVELGKDDCLISPAQKPGFVAESDGELTVVHRHATSPPS